MRRSTTGRGGNGAEDGSRSGTDASGRGQKLSRRSFVGSATALVLGGLGASALSGRARAAEIPYVTTRGHFTIDDHWFTEDDVSLTDGHDKYDYDTEGTIPRLDGGSTDEIFVWVHGWRNDLSDAKANFEEGRTALRQNGYDYPVVGYTYDADTSVMNWWPAFDIAERNGYKLASFLNDYLETGGRVRIACHSLGGKVTASTLRVMANAGYANAVESVTMLGAAVHNDECSRSGKYGPGAAQTAKQVDNFWMDGDDILQWAFGIAEADGAVGETGVEGRLPSNWEDHQVNVPDHGSYPTPGEGCMDQAVSEF